MTILLLLLIGFAASFIGTLAGSGGLIGMPSMLLIGVPIHSAIAAAKFSNIFSSFSSFLFLLKNKNITIKEVSKTAPFGLAGGISGGMMANAINEDTMTIIAVVLLSFALIMALMKKPSEAETGNPGINWPVYPALFGIGAYDGMFGPGQATLLMHTFIHSGFTYIKAMAFTRFQTFISCFGSFFSFLAAGNFDLQTAVFLASGSFLGAQTAVRLAGRISPIYLKRMLHLVTILLIIQLTYRLIVH
ncbi:sulfite exporter TauE/SafE family protein [Bacillus sp. T33-2]|uniref:sulfite exporter TauE/SafE family protein n=1 Tax=Bacillus sp. T33-2 TaxID=2054168 RepID=UPI000C78FAD0|nr:sulfite exporter TauE/SafE family protein [Bacillus sp. T33-2]PLR97460.1 sulfite exporter TauE/SafE family protein [Bacillus sp. T33-2]